jgi:hypothetical protein
MKNAIDDRSAWRLSNYPKRIGDLISHTSAFQKFTVRLGISPNDQRAVGEEDV